MNEVERWLRLLLQLPEPGSSAARKIDRLHFSVIGVAMLGASLVTVATLWFVVRYREGARRVPRPSPRQTRRVEFALSALVLVLFITFWVIGFKQYLTLRSAPRDTLDVYVVGKQWVWKFSHPEGIDELETLTVPAGRPVRLVMTSRDVIHSFYVPAFRIKHDVLPGRYVSVWFEAETPGAYEIFCAEFCGLSHSEMRGEVRALSPVDYARWLNEQRPPQGESLVALGQAVAARRQCLGCHTSDGRRHVGPTWRGLFDSWVTLDDGRRVLADEEYLTRSMMEPMADRVAGYRPVMPTYQGSLPSGEVAALLEYIKSVRQPPDPSVAALPPLGGEP